MIPLRAGKSQLLTHWLAFAHFRREQESMRSGAGSGRISQSSTLLRLSRTLRHKLPIAAQSLAYARALKSLIQETPHLPRPARMLQLPQRLSLDLPDALAGDRELLADLFERVVGVHADAEAHAQDSLLAGG